MSSHPDRRPVPFAGRVLFLLVLAFAGVGGPAIGMCPAVAHGTAIGHERAGQDRARLASHQVSVLTDAAQHRASQRSSADVVEPMTGTRTPSAPCRWSRRDAFVRHVPSCVALRAPERGPPSLQLSP